MRFFFELIKTVMEISSLFGNLSAITGVFFFLWNFHGPRFFFFTQHPFLTSAVILTLHETLLLIARGRRGFIIVFMFLFFSVISSNVGDTL